MADSIVSISSNPFDSIRQIGLFEQQKIVELTEDFLLGVCTFARTFQWKDLESFFYATALEECNAYLREKNRDLAGKTAKRNETPKFEFKEIKSDFTSRQFASSSYPTEEVRLIAVANLHSDLHKLNAGSKESLDKLRLASVGLLDEMVEDSTLDRLSEVIDSALGIALEFSDLCSFASSEFAKLVEKSKTIIAKRESKITRKPKQVEKHLEEDLYLWLISHGVDVYRQTSTKSSHRLDLWIPGEIMLELKAGKITGDDICQALDYFSTYEKPILLVGTGMTDKAGRGLNAINHITVEDSLLFTTWAAAKPYLKSALRL